MYLFHNFEWELSLTPVNQQNIQLYNQNLKPVCYIHKWPKKKKKNEQKKKSLVNKNFENAKATEGRFLDVVSPTTPIKDFCLQAESCGGLGRRLRWGEYFQRDLN